MKPKNFPERRRQRQIAALQRLLDDTPPSILANPYSREHGEVAILERRTAGSRRGERSKKNRRIQPIKSLDI